MTRRSVALVALSLLLLPASTWAQVGLGVKVGTLGLGPEISVAAGSNFVLRGGIGFFPIEPKATISDIKYTLDPPSGIWHVGADFYPGAGGWRASAGILHWPHYNLTTKQSGSTRIGGQTYTGTIDLNAAVSNAHQTAPFIALGFGRTTTRGFGLFVDLGVAFAGEADIQLTGTCTLSNGSPCPGSFQSDLEAEEADAEADAGKYLDVIPVLQVGVRIGVGR